MVHYVHVVNVDPGRSAALGKAAVLCLAAWLAWHFLPEGWSMASMWLDGVWHAITTPFVWVAGAVDSAFRVAALAQAVLLPVWALLAGCCIGQKDERDDVVLWLGAVGLNALCALLLGYPVLACMVVVGSLAAFKATTALSLSVRSRAGWLAAALVSGLSAWGTQRYGTAFAPVCWPLLPLSWCCLALGAASGVRREAGGWLRDRGAARLLLLASAVALAAAGPFAADAARAAGLLPGMPPPVPTRPAPAVAGDAPAVREAAGSALPVRQPAPASAQHRSGQDAKPASASQLKRPRT